MQIVLKIFKILIFIVFTEKLYYNNFVCTSRIFWTKNGMIYKILEQKYEKSVKGFDDRGACYRLESNNAPFSFVEEMVSVSELIIKITLTINRQNA